MRPPRSGSQAREAAEGRAAARTRHADARGGHPGAAAVAGIVLAVLCALAALVCLGLSAYGRFALADSAPMGARFAGRDVSGMSRSRLERLVRKEADASRLVLTVSAKGSGGEGTRRLETSASDLGARVDAKATVSAIVGSKGTNPLVRACPWTHVSTGLKGTVDTVAIQKRLDARLVDEQHRKVISPSVSYDAGKQKFVMNPGQNGQRVDVGPVKAAIRSVWAAPGTRVRVATSFVPIPSSVGEGDVRRVTDEANARLGQTYAVTAGDRTFTVPRAQLAQWIHPAVNERAEAGARVSLNIDSDAARQWVGANVPSKLYMPAIDEVRSTDSVGKTVLRHGGSDGLSVTSVADAATRIAQGLQSGRPVTAAAQTRTLPHASRTLTAPGLSVKDGKWMLVDLSNQTLSTYQGTQLVKVYPVATGKPGHETPTGSDYAVGIRTTSQTMRGPGYVTPNVRWVDYFYQSYATHAAPWNLGNIAAGHPSSHGCVNMVPADAQEVYGFADPGTPVEVIGTSARWARPTTSIAAAEAYVNGRRS